MGFEQNNMTKSVASQITGDDIISELIRNADAGAFKVRYTILVPCIFNVYLHPRDYELIQPIAELIQEEAVRALNSSSVDALLWKGSPKTTKVQRVGIAIWGLTFLSLGALLLIPDALPRT